MGLILVGLTLAAVIGLYFRFNPMAHGKWFMIRRFVNWFPLGLSYSFLYMGRNNLNVTQDAMSDIMTADSFGTIFAVGAIVYAISLVVNGPIVDKIGGKKGILIATTGAAAANAALGVATYLLLNGKLPFNMTLTFSILYAINMYFQSYGAVSIIKVKAYWFHVRERGVFGAIFGALISLGIYLAFDWGGAIVKASAVKVEKPSFLGDIFQSLFHVRDGSHDAIWLAYFIPAGIMIFFAIVDAFLIKDSPKEAGLEDFDTHDASSDEMHLQFSMMDLLKKVFSSPILMMVGLVELTNGVVRNGIVNWYFPYLKGTHAVGAEFFHDNWGLLLFLGGMGGGFASGYISDKWFHSRRGPPVVMAGVSITVLLLLMTSMLFSSPVGVGVCAVLIGFFTISIHALMSGTAGADFGGRKATATAAGVTDGFVYLGAGIQSLALKQITLISWQLWPVFLIPFSFLGLYFATRIWRALPEATKRYLLVVEKVTITSSPEGSSIEATRIVEETRSY